MNMQDKLDAFKRLLIIMDELREQCPWDRKQTMQSLRNLTIEETYELADAILDNDTQEIKEEIGDIMLHMVFYSGFEWENADQVWEKVEEEIQEFKEVVDVDQEKMEDEFGDVMFSLINYARFKGIDPETALEKVNRKFKSRFEYKRIILLKCSLSIEMDK